MVSSFKQYLVEETKTVYFTFGRMNPPTIGHEKLLEKLSSVSAKNPYFVFLSQSQDKKSNPLSYQQKVKHARKMFPRHARAIMFNKKVKTVLDAASALYDQGYKTLVMVVGSDRVNQFQALLDQYNGKKSKHGFYNFNTINVVSAGQRDPDADDVSGMSASKQRGYAKDNDFISFSQGVGTSLNNKDARKLFNDVRVGMGLIEERDFKKHVKLEPVSENRESYITGNLFGMGDSVSIKGTKDVGVIEWLGSNYVLVTLQEGKKVRKWLHDVELLSVKEETKQLSGEKKKIVEKVMKIRRKI